MADDVKPPVRVHLRWEGELRFAATSGSQQFVVDSEGTAGPSPMQLVGAGLAGCMAIDVAHILTRGRHDVQAIEVDLRGERATGTPAYFTRMRLHFVVTGDLADEPIGRAIALSREKYCSVWHSLRRDIELTTTFERRAEAAAV